MTDKEKITAEVVRRRNIVKNSALQMKDVEKRNHYLEMVEEYDDILRYIDSSPSEPVSKDLEEAAEKYAYEICPSIGVANTETELAFKAGAKWQKEQMIKQSLPADVNINR